MATKKTTKTAAKATKAPAKPMTKDEIREALATATGYTKASIGEVYDAIVELIAQQTKANKAFSLPGIGKFTVVRRAARTGKNPQTGAEIKIPAKDVVKFSVSKIIKDKVLG